MKQALDKLLAQNLAQVLVGEDGDRADEHPFIHAQESAMRWFWKETEKYDL